MLFACHLYRCILKRKPEVVIEALAPLECVPTKVLSLNMLKVDITQNHLLTVSGLLLLLVNTNLLVEGFDSSC